jgi:hypothetical protein
MNDELKRVGLPTREFYDHGVDISNSIIVYPLSRSIKTSITVCTSIDSLDHPMCLIWPRSGPQLEKHVAS